MDAENEKARRAAVADAEALCRDVLPRLPGDGFFAAAYAELAARGAFDEPSLATAAEVAATLAAASGALGLTYAIGHGFAQALRRASRASAPGAGAARPGHGSIGVVAFGAFSTPSGNPRHDAPELELTGDVQSVAGGPDASRFLVVGTLDSSSHAVALVERSTPGVVLAPSIQVVGFDRIPTGSLRFGDVVVGESSLFATGHAAEALARGLRSAERTLTAAVAVGVGRHAFRAAVEHLRSLGTAPSQSVEFSLSDVATELDAAELSARRAARLADAGAEAALESASAKHLAARAATHAAHTALGIAETGIYTGELRQCYLDACSLESRAGTAAELWDTIASGMLGES